MGPIIRKVSAEDKGGTRRKRNKASNRVRRGRGILVTKEEPNQMT